MSISKISNILYSKVVVWNHKNRVDNRQGRNLFHKA